MRWKVPTKISRLTFGNFQSQKDFGLDNAIYPWNISSPFSQRRPQRDGHLRKTGKWSCCLLLLMSFSKQVFAGAKHVNRKKTFCILGKWFCTHFRVNHLFKRKTLRNTNLEASRSFKIKKPHFRLTSVDQKRLCLSYLMNHKQPWDFKTSTKNT